MVGRSWLHETLRLTPTEVEPDSAAVVGGRDGKKSTRGTFTLTWSIVEQVCYAAQWSPDHTRQLEPHLSRDLDRPGGFRNVDSIKTPQHGIKSCGRVVAWSHPMGRENQQKRIVTQCVDDSSQAAVDGLVHVE